MNRREIAAETLSVIRVGGYAARTAVRSNTSCSPFTVAAVKAQRSRRFVENSRQPR